MLMIWPVFIALVVSPLLSCFGVSLFVVCCVLPLVECASPVDYDRCIQCVFDEIHTNKVFQSWYIRNDEPRKCWWFLAELLSTTFQQTLELQSVDVLPGWGHLTLQYLLNWLKEGSPCIHYNGTYTQRPQCMTSLTAIHSMRHTQAARLWHCHSSNRITHASPLIASPAVCLKIVLHACSIFQLSLQELWSSIYAIIIRSFRLDVSDFVIVHSVIVSCCSPIWLCYIWLETNGLFETSDINK